MSHIAEIIVRFTRFTLAFPALALCLGSAGQAQDRSPGTASNPAFTDRPQTSFLTPLTDSLFLSADEFRARSACGHDGTMGACAPILRYNGGGQPGPFIPPVKTANAPNLLVVFELQRITNEPIAGEGVAPDAGGWPDDVVMAFRVSSSVSTEEFPAGESPGDVAYVHIDPDDMQPGETVNGNWVIWSNFVADGCSSPPSVVPVHFESWVHWIPDDFSNDAASETFEATDDSTLVPTGFWSFHYRVRDHSAFFGDEIISDFHFSGKVSVMCTGEDGLSFE